MKKSLLAVLLVSILASTTHADSPLTMNGWQLHDYDIPKLEEAVKKAPEYGVNFFIFSHEFFRSVEGFLASDDNADPKNPPDWVKQLHTPEYFHIIPGWQSDLRHIGDLATAEHIPYYLWVHEFDDVPNRFIKDKHVDMNDPQLYDYLQQRYERLLQAVPGTAGFVLTLHESDFKVFRNSDVISDDDLPHRIVKVTMLLHDVLKKHGKQLILRNFFYEPQEMEYFKQAVPMLPDDIIIMSKDTTHEFQPFYPWDPLHGQVGNKKQIIEVDLGVEKAWSSHGAYAQTDYIRRVVQRAVATHITGIVGRARMIGDDPFVDSHEVNLYAFSRFMADPTATVDGVLHDWAAKRYPPQAVPYIVSAYKRTEFINHHGRWHLEYWFTKDIGAEWADYPYYYGHLLERSRYKWTHDPADQTLEAKLFDPDEETYDKLVAEKDEVVKQAQQSLADIHQTSRYLTADQLAPLQDDFRFLLDAAQLQREWIKAYFSMRMYMEGEKPNPAYRQRMEDALTELQKIEATPGVMWGMNPETHRRYNIDGFVLEMHWRVANRARAIAEDKAILKEVEKNVDVVNH